MWFGIIENKFVHPFFLGLAVTENVTHVTHPNVSANHNAGNVHQRRMVGKQNSSRYYPDETKSLFFM